MKQYLLTSVLALIAGHAMAQDVRIVLPEEPATLDPCMTSANVNGRVTGGNVYEARNATTGEVVPRADAAPFLERRQPRPYGPL